MRFTTPWNIGITANSTVEISMANDDEARELAKHLERNGIVCTIDHHWIQAEVDWASLFDVLRTAVAEDDPTA